jgi:hypothetical protein
MHSNICSRLNPKKQTIKPIRCHFSFRLDINQRNALQKHKIFEILKHKFRLTEIKQYAR